MDDKRNVRKCTCKHDYQDKVYGKGYRLHNRTTDRTATGNWRCTVCKATR